MSDFFENIVETTGLENRVCRVAYTLDNAQPVLCSIIGDQPLFYMDFEDDILDEDDGFFDGSELGLLDYEIQTLKEEIAGFESYSPLVSQGGLMERVEEFSENIDYVTGAKDFGDKPASLKEIQDVLVQSRLASAYLDFAREHKINIVISKQVEKAFYDRRSGTISLNPDLSRTEQVLLMVRELRRHWQHRNGVLINPLMFQPENAILVNRSQEADLTISMVRVAWELQLAGIHEVWERLENSPMGDLARAFAREAFMDFRTINNGVASAAVFEAWFLSERCRQQDKKIIQAMLADYKGYVFDNPGASESVTAELISGLGSMPYGKNYLAVHAVTIMSDPIFTEVRDRSNANFLWFIKFERSFKETERALQTDTDLSTHDVRHDLLNAQSQDRFDENQKAAEIIHLFPQGLEASAGGKGSKLLSDKRRSAGSAEIIDFKRWSER
ncbi:MAG: hypothetical protein KDI13_05945 [Alphaproteobacteria bacterium]|nr:hypothetical protein [Alphaproteobacteria bacterium]